MCFGIVLSPSSFSIISNYLRLSFNVFKKLLKLKEFLSLILCVLKVQIKVVFDNFYKKFITIYYYMNFFA